MSYFKKAKPAQTLYMLSPTLKHLNIYRNKVHLSSNKLKNFFHLLASPPKCWKIARRKKIENNVKKYAKEKPVEKCIMKRTGSRKFPMMCILIKATRAQVCKLKSRLFFFLLSKKKMRSYSNGKTEGSLRPSRRLIS